MDQQTPFVSLGSKRIKSVLIGRWLRWKILAIVEKWLLVDVDWLYCLVKWRMMLLVLCWLPQTLYIFDYKVRQPLRYKLKVNFYHNSPYWIIPLWGSNISMTRKIVRNLILMELTTVQQLLKYVYIHLQFKK